MSMIFKEARSGYPVSVFDKNNITLHEGKVVSVSAVRTELNKSTGLYGAYIDVTIEVNGRTATYTIPEQSSVALAADGLLMSLDKSLLIPEVEVKISAAKQVLASVEDAKQTIEKAEPLLAKLNPTLKEKQETNERFNKMEQSLDRLTQLVESIVNPKNS